MKKILFPSTNRVHKARQQFLLKELSKDFQVYVHEYKAIAKDILSCTAYIQAYFMEHLANDQYDLALIRGDRFEMLPIAMLCAYKGIPIAHIEGGDLSGAIDNKVRYAITALADLHFPTNRESADRLRIMDKENVFNFGSLDVEYAKEVHKSHVFSTNFPYIVMCHHAMKGEDPALIEKVIREEFDGEVIVIKSNSDNGISYGDEELTPEEYICHIGAANLLIGNSSSFIKEASVFGTPVVLVGDRQKNRLLTPNIKEVKFDENEIREAIRFQLKAIYESSNIYYQEGTASKIANQIKEFLEV